MKRCPKCQSTYTDDSLRFCLQDGTALVGADDAPRSYDSEKTLIYSSPSAAGELPPTELYTARSAQTDPISPISNTAPHQPRPDTRDMVASSPTSPIPTRQRSSAFAAIAALTAAVLLLMLGGAAAWWFMRGDNSGGTNQPPKNASPAPTVMSQNGQATPAASVGASLTATPSPTPTPKPVDTAAVREQVITTLNGWVASSRARDIDKHMDFYADTLDTYYKAANVSASRVRTDRSRAYTLYSTLDIELSNVKVAPDPTGERATATFDKTWTFEGDEKYSSGSVNQKVWLRKINGRWRITGEKDVQIYYVNSY